MFECLDRLRDDTLTFPSARRAASKKSITPKNMNSVPNVVSATPISAREMVSLTARRTRPRENRLCASESHIVDVFYDGLRVSYGELVEQVAARMCRVRKATSPPLLQSWHHQVAVSTF